MVFTEQSWSKCLVDTIIEHLIVCILTSLSAAAVERESSPSGEGSSSDRCIFGALGSFHNTETSERP